MAKRYRTRAIKTHRSYTVEEAAGLVGVHPQTVRGWIKRGLRALASERPMLILGSDLRAYLEELNTTKRPLKRNELYCAPCHAAVTPWGLAADFVLQAGRPGRLVGLCPVCESACHRFVAHDQITEVAPDLEIAFTAAETSLSNLLCSWADLFQPMPLRAGGDERSGTPSWSRTQ